MTDWADREATRFMLAELEPLPGRGPHAQERLAALLRDVSARGERVAVLRLVLDRLRATVLTYGDDAFDKACVDAALRQVKDLETQLRDLESGE